jgi:very-short-patch-repair endonuclease
MSKPEVRLWIRLRERAPGKPVFRRQHPVGPYILDFYCSAARLAIEIDGISHDMGDAPQHDRHRDEWLKQRGIVVIRIPTRDLTNIDETADSVARLAADLASKLLAPSTALRAVPLPRFAGEDGPSREVSTKALR